MKRFPSLIALIFIFSNSLLNAQTSKAYLALGANLTEANLTNSGISQVGTRMGLNIGPGVSVIINKRWATNMELLYSQNGAYVNFAQTPSLALDKITLHYIEVPLTLTYRFNIKTKQKEGFYKQHIGGGITYARLFKHKTIAVNGTDVTDNVRFEQENALLFNFSATSFLNPSFALNARGTLSTFGEWTLALRLLYYI